MSQSYGYGPSSWDIWVQLSRMVDNENVLPSIYFYTFPSLVEGWVAIDRKERGEGNRARAEVCKAVIHVNHV